MTEMVHYEEPARLLPAINPAREHTDGWIAVIEPVTQLAEAVAATEFVPKALRDNPPAVAACILFGRELDMPPMQSLSEIHMIEGRPSVSAEHVRAMVLAAGHEIAYTELTGGSVTVQGRRKGSTLPPTVVTWTLAMAAVAELTGKKNWRRHPRQMLEARATAELCRLIFADVTHGVRVTEELEDEQQSGDGPAPESGRSRVSRAKKGAESTAAAGAQTGAPPSPESVPVATRAPRPPLPERRGGAGSEASTPGEGRKSTSSAASEPAANQEAASIATQAHGQCPHISNGVQCTYPVHGPEALHSYQLDASYGGTAPASEGDGSPDDVAATGADDVVDAEIVDQPDERHCPDWENAHPRHRWEADGSPWECPGTSAAAAGGPVEDKPEKLHPGQNRAIFAALKSLGVEDDAERHHTASALLGWKVTSFTELTSEDGSRMLAALGRVETRDDLEALIQAAAEKWGEGGA